MLTQYKVCVPPLLLSTRHTASLFIPLCPEQFAHPLVNTNEQEIDMVMSTQGFTITQFQKLWKVTQSGERWGSL